MRSGAGIDLALVRACVCGSKYGSMNTVICVVLETRPSRNLLQPTVLTVADYTGSTYVRHRAVHRLTGTSRRPNRIGHPKPHSNQRNVHPSRHDLARAGQPVAGSANDTTLRVR